jgi:hypothetical protein
MPPSVIRLPIAVAQALRNLTTGATCSGVSSVGAWPIGLREAEDFPAIALVEGSADLLAALHLA